MTPKICTDIHLFEVYLNLHLILGYSIPQTRRLFRTRKFQLHFIQCIYSVSGSNRRRTGCMWQEDHSRQAFPIHILYLLSVW